MALSMGGEESQLSKSAGSTVAVGAEKTFVATSLISFGSLRGFPVSNPRPRVVTQSIIFVSDFVLFKFLL